MVGRVGCGVMFNGVCYATSHIYHFSRYMSSDTCVLMCVDMYVCVCAHKHRPVSRMDACVRACVHACVILYSTVSQNLAILRSFEHV